MTIGELLKKYRLNMGLTLSEMAADIVSTSYYSKVEKNQHRISAEDLFEILRAHSISLGNFLNQLTQDKDNFKKYTQKIISLYYEGDIEGIKTILTNYKKKDAEDKQDIVALGESCLYDLDKTFNISDASKEMIKEKIFSLPNWNLFKLSIYTNFISLYDINTNQLIISSVLSREISKYSKDEQSAIVAILLNFVDELIDKGELLLASYYLQKVEQILTPLPELLFYHVLMNFYKNITQYLMTGDRLNLEKCEEIAEFFKNNGYETYAISLKEYLKKPSN